MARVFENLIDSSPYYKIDLIVGGWYIGNRKVLCWTQERAVLSIDGLGSVATAQVTITAGAGLPDEKSVMVEVSFASSQIQYVDITDVLRSVFNKSRKTTISDTGTAGILSFMFYDSLGQVIVKDPYVVDFNYYDALLQSVNNDVCIAISDRWLLPDTFRIPSKYTCGKYPLQACTRVTRGAEELIILDNAGATIESMNNIADPLELGWEFYPADHPAEVRLQNNVMGVVEKARVIAEDCMDNKLVLTWWSPMCGGWKSVVAEVMGASDEVSESERYLLGWDYGEAKGGMIGLRVKIPNCTPRDYDYYRDIYYSGMVQVYDEALWAYNQNVQPIEKSVMVKGNPPQPKLTGYVDLEMTLMTAEVSSIW